MSNSQNLRLLSKNYIFFKKKSQSSCLNLPKIKRCLQFTEIKFAKLLLIQIYKLISGNGKQRFIFGKFKHEDCDFFLKKI
jgi:hypothetical protein